MPTVLALAGTDSRASSPSWASTPRSIASSDEEEAGEECWPPQVVGGRAAQHCAAAFSPHQAQPHGSSMADHPGGWEAAQRSQAASAAVDDRVQSPQAEGEAIRQGLLTSRRQLSLLRRQLLAMQREAARQQQLVETLLMEKECELRLARAEAEAHRTAGRARSAVVATLQRWAQGFGAACRAPWVCSTCRKGWLVPRGRTRPALGVLVGSPRCSWA